MWKGGEIFLENSYKIHLNHVKTLKPRLKGSLPGQYRTSGVALTRTSQPLGLLPLLRRELRQAWMVPSSPKTSEFSSRSGMKGERLFPHVLKGRVCLELSTNYCYTKLTGSTIILLRTDVRVACIGYNPGLAAVNLQWQAAENMFESW